MSLNKRILIVDASAESREILCTLFEREGVETLEAVGAGRAEQLIHDRRPHLIVYDAESERQPSPDAQANLGQTATRNDIPIVVLGTARRDVSPPSDGSIRLQALPLRAVDP